MVIQDEHRKELIGEYQLLVTGFSQAITHLHTFKGFAIAGLSVSGVALLNDAVPPGAILLFLSIALWLWYLEANTLCAQHSAIPRLRALEKVLQREGDDLSFWQVSKGFPCDDSGRQTRWSAAWDRLIWPQYAIILTFAACVAVYREKAAVLSFWTWLLT